MTWNFAVGVVLGAVAVALVLVARRVSSYCMRLWHVVASIEPRRHGTHVRAAEQPLEPTERQLERASEDDPVHGGK